MKTKDDLSAPASWLPPVDRVPEARGPGVEDGSGAVSYGAGSPDGVIPAADPDVPAVNADQGSPRCGWCQDIPDDLLAAITHALATARKAGGRR